VRAHAGVRPFRGPRNQFRAHGIERDIANGGDQMTVAGAPSLR
jgi:hypothetical protein